MGIRLSAGRVATLCCAIVLGLGLGRPMTSEAQDAGAPEAGSPEETLRVYLAAMKVLDFGKVYDLSTKAASQGKDRDTWATEMKYLFQLSDAKIFEYKVFPATVKDDKALVPNILTSQDKFLNQLAAPEYELYTLMREDGSWKVDHQTIVDQKDLPKWFPGEG